jgi:hypothetical protein
MQTDQKLQLMLLLNTSATTPILKHFRELITAYRGIYKVKQTCRKNRNTPNEFQVDILSAEWLQRWKSITPTKIIAFRVRL